MSAKLEALRALKPALEFVDVTIAGVDGPLRLKALNAGQLLELRAEVMAAPLERREITTSILSVLYTAVNDDGSRLFESRQQIEELPPDVFIAISEAATKVLGVLPAEAAKNSPANPN